MAYDESENVKSIKYTLEDQENAQADVDNLEDAIESLVDLDEAVTDEAADWEKLSKPIGTAFRAIEAEIANQKRILEWDLEGAKEHLEEVDAAMPDPNDEHRLTGGQLL